MKSQEVNQAGLQLDPAGKLGDKEHEHPLGCWEGWEIQLFAKGKRLLLQSRICLPGGLCKAVLKVAEGPYLKSLQLITGISVG